MFKSRLKLSVLVMSILSVVGIVAIPVTARATPLYYGLANVTYDSANQKMDVYRPASGTNHPIVIMIHGGGFVDGTTRSIMDGQSMALASNNIDVLNIDYRLAPENPFPDAYQDVLSAISWAKINAAGINGNPNNIILVGYSAGANLAMLAGLHDPSQVHAIVGAAGPYDLTALTTNPLISQDIAEYMGSTSDAYGSPINAVVAGDPSVFLLHGDSDTTVPESQAYNMAAQLQQFKVPVMLKIYPGAGHDLYLPSSSAYPQASADILTYIQYITTQPQTASVK